MPEFGGERTSEDDTLEIKKNNENDEWGAWMCFQISTALAGSERADFYTHDEVALFRVEKIGPDMYTIRDIKERKVYSVTHQGEPNQVMLEGQMLDEKSLKTKLQKDVELLKFLYKREVND